ncbi:hypothetical protein QN239_31720 [Mycolicibacterium sp. Y3]
MFAGAIRKMRRRWRRTLAAVGAATVLSGGGMTAYTNPEGALGRTVGGIASALFTVNVAPTGPEGIHP